MVECIRIVGVHLRDRRERLADSFCSACVHVYLHLFVVIGLKVAVTGHPALSSSGHNLVKLGHVDLCSP
ncbi:hypothetical protein D3C80_2173310 [compost metagenome]